VKRYATLTKLRYSPDHKQYVDIDELKISHICARNSEETSFFNIGSENYSGKRKLSYKTKKSTQELYSAVNPINDTMFNKIEEETDKIKQYPIFYVDTPGTVDEVRNTIYKFIEMYAKDKWLIILYDHSLLTKQSSGEQERTTLVNLQRLFVEVKKINKTTIIQISQLNREIEEKDRLTNASLHFPQRRDISSSDSVYQCADYVLVLHRPETLGLKSYGIHNWPVSNMIYLHILKNRDGEPKILSFYNNLKFNSIEEETIN
jgi:replicative DNA helicase